tara:strand:+ start:13003 stop:14145 length:1143 start_codon:yes stop_codon:yes gene_type:complete
MKLLFFTGSRSEWGYIKPILKLCKNRNIKYKICATNMHLLDSYGNSSKEIEKEGFKISDKIYMALDGYNNFTMTKSMGVLFTSFVDTIMRIKPDWLILAGDRAETLIASIISSYCYIPIAHIQAGEVSGNIDGLARHAIGKFAHLHFASNKDAYNRLIKLGEEKHRIKLVGAPQLDENEKIRKSKISKKKILNKLGIIDSGDYFLVVYHPVTEEFSKIKKQFYILNESLKKFKNNKIWILPNNDAGSSILKDEIFKNKGINTYLFENLNRELYLGLLKHANCIVGNSSSGIIESSSFKIPAINIGRRQYKRFRPKNVLDANDFKISKIVSLIKKSQSKKFLNSIKKIKNPYGNGKSSSKILDILYKTKIDDKLLIKNLTY